jgi:hypothetical protein
MSLIEATGGDIHLLRLDAQRTRSVPRRCILCRAEQSTANALTAEIGCDAHVPENAHSGLSAQYFELRIVDGDDGATHSLFIHVCGQENPTADVEALWPISRVLSRVGVVILDVRAANGHGCRAFATTKLIDCVCVE